MTDTLKSHQSSEQKPSFSGFTLKDEIDSSPESVEVQPEKARLYGIEALRHLEAQDVESVQSYPDISDSSEVPDMSWMNQETRVVVDAHIHLSDEEAREPAKVIEAIEVQHYARVPERFADQANDPTRTNIIESQRFATSTDQVITTTEYEGLRALRKAIKEKIAEGNAYAGDLQDMLDNLTFTGEKELSEAARGIGFLWKDFLEKDERNVLCLGVIGDNDKGKSSPYIVGRILDTWSDEDLKRFSGRVVERPEELIQKGTDPDHALIVIADDSTVSGRQLIDRYRQMGDIPGIEPYLGNTADDGSLVPFVKSVEFHLIVCDAPLLENGLKIRDSYNSSVVVKSYYKTHDVGTEDSVHANLHSRKTSAFSSTDYGFNWTLHAAFGGQSEMPPLAFIKRQYRTAQPRVVIEPDGTLRRS